MFMDLEKRGGVNAMCFALGQTVENPLSRSTTTKALLDLI